MGLPDGDRGGLHSGGSAGCGDSGCWTCPLPRASSSRTRTRPDVGCPSPGSLSGSAERSTSAPELTGQRGLTVFVRELCVSVVISSRRVWGSVVVKVMSVRFYTSFSLITQERYGVRVPCSAGG